jgi:hypothetical protein
MGANGWYRPAGRERTFNLLLHKRNASQWLPAITFCVSSGWWPALNRWSSWNVSSSAVAELGSAKLTEYQKRLVWLASAPGVAVIR